MKTFLTKHEIAEILTNQYDLPAKARLFMVTKLVRLAEPYFISETLKAGFMVENFGYNRYYVR